MLTNRLDKATIFLHSLVPLSTKKACVRKGSNELNYRTKVKSPRTMAYMNYFKAQ